MHTNYYKIVKLLKTFKIIIVAPTCFDLHKPSSGSYQPVLRRTYNVDFGYISLYEVTGIVAAYGATIPVTASEFRSAEQAQVRRAENWTDHNPRGL